MSWTHFQTHLSTEQVASLVDETACELSSLPLATLRDRQALAVEAERAVRQVARRLGLPLPAANQLQAVQAQVLATVGGLGFLDALMPPASFAITHYAICPPTMTIPFLLLTLYLLPCALQDYRTHRVSNWLTVPGFCAAWPLALWLGGEERLLFTFAVFVGCWFAWQMKGMGAADGKLATLLAAVNPQALILSALVLVGMFLAARLRHKEGRSVPAAVGFYLAAVVVSLIQMERMG